MAPFLFKAGWLVVLSLALALSVFAMTDEPLWGDTRLMRWVQDQPFPGYRVSHAVRAITITQVMLVVGVIAAFVLALMGRRTDAVVLGIGLLLLPLLQWGIKELVDRARPTEPPADLRTGYGSPSFPSGHVMSPTLLYGYLLGVSLRQGLPKALRVTLGVWCTLMLLLAGPPNVWLGVHWPSDVLGAWLWALVLLGVLFFLRDAQAKRVQARGEAPLT
jgi:undecaprenyl-diphosphatase